MICSPQGTLAMSRSLSGCHDVGFAAGTQWVEAKAKEAAQPPAMLRTALATRKPWTPNVSSADVEKPQSNACKRLRTTYQQGDCEIDA